MTRITRSALLAFVLLIVSVNYAKAQTTVHLPIVSSGPAIGTAVSESAPPPPPIPPWAATEEILSHALGHQATCTPVGCTAGWQADTVEYIDHTTAENGYVSLWTIQVYGCGAHGCDVEYVLLRIDG